MKTPGSSTQPLDSFQNIPLIVNMEKAKGIKNTRLPGKTKNK